LTRRNGGTFFNPIIQELVEIFLLGFRIIWTIIGSLITSIFSESLLLFPTNRQKELQLPAVLTVVVHHLDAQYTLAEHRLLNLSEEFES